MRKLFCQRTRFLICLAGIALIPFTAFPGVDRDRLEDSDYSKTVTIVYAGSSASVVDADNAGVSVTRGGTDSALSIKSTASGVTYILSGASSSGYFQLTSSRRCRIVLDGVTLCAGDGPALSVLTGEETFLVLGQGTHNSFADAAVYSRTGKGTIHTGGALNISGTGDLNLSSSGGHGIFSTGSLRIFDGNIVVAGAAKDAVHPKTSFRMDGGVLSLMPSEDGVDAAGGIVLCGGRISFSSSVADVKALSTDAVLDISSGTIAVTLSGDQSKALSADGGISMSGGALFLNLSGGVVLESATNDAGSTYTDPSYSTAIKTDGDIDITGGTVVITHSGIAGKGLSADGIVNISGGSFDISVSGTCSSSYTNEEGVADTANASAITADGNITISDGSFRLAVLGDSAKGISTDSVLNISGGSFDVVASGDRSKGFKSDGATLLSGGTGIFVMSGAVVLEASGSYFDPSYCTAIKSGGDLTVTGGAFTITHTGLAGKGVSADGSISMSGGTFNITTSGGVSSSFTNTSGELDMASADCFKADGNLTITGGSLTATSTGRGGDAVSCDGAAVIGTLGSSSSPVISVTTSGVHVLLSGTGANADYVNPKAFKAGGNLTMNGGIFKAATSTEGGEGMESKANLVINGGTIEVTTYDDAINAASSITINGGNIYCYSSNNDGIDSNGTLTVNGGTVISSGTTAPEEGFDCDSNTFRITGGIIIGTGGATSTPTSSVCTQRSVIYKGTGTANVVIQVKSASGNVIVYKLPRSYSGGMGGSSSTAMTMLFSAPSLASGTTYTIVSGASVSGGTEFHGLYTGATVSGGTTLKTFTAPSMVNTVQ